jgi:Helicase associated domain
MPSLVSDLTPSQRMWLAETFGGPDSGEFNHLQTVDSCSESPRPFQQETTSERRVSDAAALSLSERSGVQYSPPQPANSYFSLPPAPDLQHHQPSPTGLSESIGRSAIFRRTPLGVMEHGGEAAELNPRPWTPPDRGEYTSYYSHQPHQPTPHHPRHHYDHTTSRNFAILRPASFTANNNGKHAEIDKFPNNHGGGKRPNPTSAHQTPKYPHGGDKLSWQQSYDNLKVYKETYGDCDVPQKYKHNVKLGGWVVRIQQCTFLAHG